PTKIYTLSLHDALPISTHPLISSLYGPGREFRPRGRRMIPDGYHPPSQNHVTPPESSAERRQPLAQCGDAAEVVRRNQMGFGPRSEEHTSELQSLRQIV